MKKLILIFMFLTACFAQTRSMVGRDNAGLDKFLKVNSSGQLVPSDLFIEIPTGNISGVYSINKFGRAPSGVQTTATDIWDRANATPTQQIWLPPTQARVHSIVSTSDADSTGNGGARTLRVYGLRNWNEAEYTEDVILDGTNAVNTDSAFVIIYRMKVLTNGSTSVNVGVITATAATDASVTAQINAGQGQTQMAIYAIPSTQTAYMTCYYFSIHDSQTPASSGFADVNLLVNENPTSVLTTYLTKHSQGVATFGTNYINHCYKPYYQVTGPAIIKMQATGSAADLDCSAGFDIILMDN